MHVLNKLISLLFHSLPGSCWGMCSTKTWEVKQGIKQREKSEVWEQNGQFLTSSDMASINWSLTMSWVKLPRRSWISPVWCRTFSWYILRRKELKHDRLVCDAAIVTFSFYFCQSAHRELASHFLTLLSPSLALSSRFLSLKYYLCSSSYLESF